MKNLNEHEYMLLVMECDHDRKQYIKNQRCVIKTRIAIMTFMGVFSELLAMHEPFMHWSTLVFTGLVGYSIYDKMQLEAAVKRWKDYLGL